MEPCHRRALSAMLLIVTLSLAAVDGNKMDTLNSFRLPDTVRPVNYTLKIITHFNDDHFRFYGQVLVDVDVNREISEMRLHVKQLHVDPKSVSLIPLKEIFEHDTPVPRNPSHENNIPEGNPQFGHYDHTAIEGKSQGVPIANVSTEPGIDQMVISTASPMQPGGYRLSVRYWGTLNEVDRGYYRTAYQYKNQTRWMSATVFEPAEARRAFPCFDEPHLKATFSLVLGRHQNYTSRANMPRSSLEPMAGNSGWFWDYYPPSPMMSTYLVAFMVHGLDSRLSNSSVPGRPVRVWAAPGRVQHSNFSLWLAPRVLTVLGKKLDVPAVLPKEDLVAVPGFRSEALENWGLISFEERHLLLPSGAVQLARQSVGVVVAHELAHIWFGNLLTPTWWSDIWLSEGFATYYSAVAVNGIAPNWRIHDTTAGNAFLLLTSEDASPLSPPLLQQANDPRRLTSVFNAISYFKGYWMLRMLNSTLGPAVFDDGIARYVRQNLYGSVNSSDLWSAFQDAIDSHGAGKEASPVDDSDVASSNTVVVSDGEDDVGVIVVNKVEHTDEAPESTTPEPITSSTDLFPSPEIAPQLTPNIQPSVADVKNPLVQITTDAPPPIPAFFFDVARSLAFGYFQAEIVSPSEPLDFEEATLSSDGILDVSVNDRKAGKPSKPPKVPTRTTPKTPTKPPSKKPPKTVTPSTAKLGASLMPKPISEIMRSWLTQPGYPVINVFRDYETGVVTMNQRKFTGLKEEDASCNTTWWIPLLYTTGRNANSHSLFWLPDTCENVTLPTKAPKDTWLLMNVGLTGLYRVRYDTRSWQQLARLPRSSWQSLPPLSRLQVLADSLQLAQRGLLRYQHALQLADHLSVDSHPMPWKAAMPYLLFVDRQLRGKPEGVSYKSWLNDLVAAHASSVGFAAKATDSPHQAMFRQELTLLACRADHPSCSRRARKVFKQFLDGAGEPLGAGSLLPVLYCSAMRWGNPGDWKGLHSKVSELEGPGRRAALRGLACTRDAERLRSYLAETVQANSTLRRSDILAALPAVAENELGSDLVIRFIEERAALLYSRLGNNTARVEKLIRDVSRSLSTPKQLEKLDSALQQFGHIFTWRSTPTWGREVVQENMKWLERSRADLSRWLRGRRGERSLFDVLQGAFAPWAGMQLSAWI